MTPPSKSWACQQEAHIACGEVAITWLPLGTRSPCTCSCHATGEAEALQRVSDLEDEIDGLQDELDNAHRQLKALSARWREKGLRNMAAYWGRMADELDELLNDLIECAP